MCVFYSTGETANVKSEDLSIYLDHKDKLNTEKVMKKPNYFEATKQIEEAISGMNDAAPISVDVLPAQPELEETNFVIESTAAKGKKYFLKLMLLFLLILQKTKLLAAKNLKSKNQKMIRKFQ